MNTIELNQLLNKACEIIISLEQYADEALQAEINELFYRITVINEIDDEMKL